MLFRFNTLFARSPNNQDLNVITLSRTSMAQNYKDKMNYRKELEKAYTELFNEIVDYEKLVKQQKLKDNKELNALQQIKELLKDVKKKSKTSSKLHRELIALSNENEYVNNMFAYTESDIQEASMQKHASANIKQLRDRLKKRSSSKTLYKKSSDRIDKAYNNLLSVLKYSQRVPDMLKRD